MYVCMYVFCVFRKINGFFFKFLSFGWECIWVSVRQELILYIQFRRSLASRRSKFYAYLQYIS